MSTHLPPSNTAPPEPLDGDERELARILRALPGGEPPAALDAAILRAATNAAAASRRPGARILASAGALWGIGSAAAAVLALGVAWQMRYGDTHPAAATSAPHAQAVSEVDEDDAVQVDLGAAREQEISAAPPPADLANQPAATAPALPSRLRQKAMAAPAAAPAAPAPAPEPFALDRLDEHVAGGAAANATAQAEEAKDNAQLDKERSAYGLARDAAAPAAKAAAQAQSAAPAVTATESRAELGAAAATSGLVSPREAPQMKPAIWFTEIRRLRDEGKIAQARAKLVEFRRAYPKWVVPTDLAPLLDE